MSFDIHQMYVILMKIFYYTGNLYRLIHIVMKYDYITIYEIFFYLTAINAIINYQLTELKHFQKKV